MSSEALQAHLTERCAYWQERLRLQDWRVTIRLVDRHEMGSDWRHGSITYSRRACLALLKVIRAEDMDPTCLVKQDYEDTIVHELLHVHFLNWPIEGRDGEDIPESVPMEVAINSIAGALVELERARETAELTQRAMVECAAAVKEKNDGK